MAKRKTAQTNKSSVNPLSDARRAQERKDQESPNTPHDKHKLERPIVSKADLKAKELWHRKSGAGYHLFVEYYGGQPKGVAYDDSDQALSSDGGTSMSMMAGSKQGKGMSRAAKRRKKKSVSNQEQPSDDSMQVSSDDPIVRVEASISTKFEPALKDKPDCKRISTLLSSMSTALPLTLRIRHPSFLTDETLQSDAKQVIQQLAEKYSHLVQAVGYDATKSTIYQSAPNSGVTKFSLGKISPDLKALIVQATASGIMARQELGSMLPVIALSGIEQMQYGSKVLDMCASPGSKMLQALEIVASSPVQPPKRKQGRIVANDIHPLRLDSLKDEILRSGVSMSLTDRTVYTNHDASKFPTSKSGSTFDCIIADVPCSGDGTIRKDPHILPGWMPSISNSLHELQLNILKRSIKLLKVGGVVAYSTCSLNPIEDEAVVAGALSWANRFEEGSVELLDWPEQVLPGFKRRPGVDTWSVANYHWGDVDSEKDDDDDDLESAPKLNWYDLR